MSLIRWEPQRELGSLHNSIRRMFEDFDRNFSQNTSLASQGAFLPSVDINEDKDNLYFIMDLPGLTSNDVKLTVAENVLTVRGERQRKNEQNDRHHYRLERSFGAFIRQYALPEGIREEDIEANFDNGVLEIQIPKQEPAKPREREVHIGSKHADHRLGDQPATTNEIHVTETGKLTNAKRQTVGAEQHN